MEDAGIVSDIKIFFFRKLKFFHKRTSFFSDTVQKESSVSFSAFKSSRTGENAMPGVDVQSLKENAREGFKMSRDKKAEIECFGRDASNVYSLVAGRAKMRIALQCTLKEVENPISGPFSEDSAGEGFIPTGDIHPPVGQYLY